MAGSTGDRELVAKTIAQYGVTAIIHFAASIVVPDSVRDPLGYYRNNTMNTCALLDAAIEAGVRQVIFSSTAAVYGNAEECRAARGRADGADLALRHLEADVGDHAARRRQGARPALRHPALLQCRRRRSARPHRPVDAGRDPSDQGRLRGGARQAAEDVGLRHRLSDTPDGTCIRDYIHVSDLARAHSAALGHLRRGGASATFNCGYGRGCSVFEVIDAVRRVSGRDFPVEIEGRRPGDPAALVANVDRIRATLPWQPQFQDLDTIVAHALAWEKRLQGKRSHSRA